MGLQDDINKLTLMPSNGVNPEAKFVPLNGKPGRAERDIARNNRPVRLRNPLKYDDDDDDADDDDKYNQVYSDNPVDNIESTLRFQSYSNESIEQYFKERQSKKEDPTVTRLMKNGVIRGLVNQNIISKSDLVNKSSEKVQGEVRVEDCPSSSKTLLVEHPEHDDVLIHPLLVGGKLPYTEDFVLDRIGTKTTITPTAYIKSLGDEHLKFQKQSK